MPLKIQHVSRLKRYCPFLFSWWLVALKVSKGEHSTKQQHIYIYIYYNKYFFRVVFPVTMWSLKWWLWQFMPWTHGPWFLSFSSFLKCISQVLQEENTHVWSIVLCVVVSNRPLRASVVVYSSEAWSHRGNGALLALAGTGLAALLSVELVVTHAVLGNQVTPAEVVHAVFVCW